MIRLQNVRFAYTRNERVLEDASLEIGAGLSLLVGPNGSGKSTLLKILAGIERPDAGTAAINGFDLWQDEVAARRELVYVSEHADLTPYATIRDVITLVCRLRSVSVQAGSDALARAGLGSVADRSIRELSMGQRRRAVLAAAWVGEPRVAILDEPLEAMDRAIRADILSWIDRVLDTGAAVVIATHQIDPFVDRAERVIALVDGTWRPIEPLPSAHGERLALLDALSRQRG